MVLGSGFQNGFLIVPTEHRRHRTDEPWQGHCYSQPRAIATSKYKQGTSLRIHWGKIVETARMPGVSDRATSMLAAHV